MRRTTQRQIDAVLQLDGPTRYMHFVKRVVDDERAWGLWNDGWVLSSDGAGQSIFLLWPAQEYASLCALGEWKGSVAEKISLADLVGELLPKLAERDVRPGVFPTPAGTSLVPTVQELLIALRTEMEKY